MLYSGFLTSLLGNEVDKEKTEEMLRDILEDKRGKLEEIKIDNPDYDEELAKIGKEEAKDDEE